MSSEINPSIEETRILLVAQMKRAVELLESENFRRYSYSKELAELDNKLLEIRRDSVRYINEVRNPYRIKRENSIERWGE